MPPLWLSRSLGSRLLTLVSELLDVLIPKILGESSLAQIMARLIEAHFFMCVHGLPPPNVGLKSSALAMGKTRCLYLKGKGFSKWSIWQANR